ncbi:MAG: class I SAM-dependent methyltransferase [Maricaulaceae bacterium]
MTKFSDWWEGLDTKRGAPEPQADEPQAEVEPAPEFDPVAAKLEALEEAYGVNAHFLALERLWGKGRIGSVAGAEPAALMHALKLSEETQVLGVGCGLSGLAQGLVKASGAWVTLLDWRVDLAAVARQRVKHARLQKKVMVEPWTEAGRVSNRRFDAAYSVESMMFMKDKGAVPARVASALKPGARFLVVEPVLDEGGKIEGAAAAFRTAPTSPALWTAKQWMEKLGRAGLDAQRPEEVTGQAVLELRGAFAKLHKNLAEVADDAKKVESAEGVLRLLALEAEDARDRLRALERGDVAVYRFLAQKPRPDENA